MQTVIKTINDVTGRVPNIIVILCCCYLIDEKSHKFIDFFFVGVKIELKTKLAVGLQIKHTRLCRIVVTIELVHLQK